MLQFSKFFFIPFIILLMILNSCSSNYSFANKNNRDIRYIVSKINTVNKQSIVLQDGTAWGFGHFSINTPGNEIIITYYESSFGGTAYINGVERNVKYLGSAYNGASSVNDILKFGEGKLFFISKIDTSGAVITLDDSTNWIVRPDQREQIKKWEPNEEIILDNSKNYIVNPRIYKIVAVKEYKEQ